ncbi:pyrroloquinoline quinone biosynthesis protein PqqB [Candidatus Methylacidithermus pantelleriae]|uniref:Coenzyme PQQ synthesis protein B n=1 Tax=Candidatus Methylacidithermus pantelleriae TaxID=2744239 RepID=A0A8J2FSN3_9BACT|nr:pyrroloquinoline quinone biosynthesis protein PqqB [Candidatus Methylacidithermus pantelleriae]CAF0697551.1 Coenzyme PQQ synthesis protein B [Candidatus Methylacidithermus pantelleriae]
MELIVLGSAAGGGVPQWNCACSNCRQARLDRQAQRTQSSVAVSADRSQWVLCNASPDVRVQLALAEELSPQEGGLRGTPIRAVALTDAQIDHTVGLLSLREGSRLEVICTPEVERLLREDFPIFPTLEKYLSLTIWHYPVTIGNLSIEALDLEGSPPPYAAGKATCGQVVALSLFSPEGKQVVYAPALPKISPAFVSFVSGAHCLLVDGTFWSENELPSLGVHTRTAREMGHLPIAGPEGSLRWLAKLEVPKKIYVHINNTNPILDPLSKERAHVESQGLTIASDGMKIRV